MLHRSDSHRLEDYLADETLRAEQVFGDVREGDGKGGKLFFFLIFTFFGVRVRGGALLLCVRGLLVWRLLRFTSWPTK